MYKYFRQTNKKNQNKIIAMKKFMLIVLLLVACGVLMGQSVVDISYNWDEENHICVTSQPLNLSTIMEGEWSGPGVVDNIFSPSTIPAGSTTKLMCNNKEFLIIVHPAPTVYFGWMPKEVNVGSQPIQLSGYPADGTWSVNGKTFDGKFVPEKVGVYEIIYMLTDEYGCTSGVVEHIVVK